MTPQKRQKANVKKILDNPVQSKAQEILRPKKEGFFGWLSYLGWSLMFFLIGTWIILLFLHTSNYYVVMPDWFPSPLTIIFIGSILTLITMIKNKHLHAKGVLFALFALTVIGSSIMLMLIKMKIPDLSEVAILDITTGFAYTIFCFYSLCWYPYYFYKKSKEGYRYVWLKVLLFTFLPFLSFIGAEVEEFGPIFRTGPRRFSLGL